MGNKNRKQAREPIEKTFSNDKLGSIVRKERQKAEAAAEWDEMEAIRRSQQYDFTTASAPENAVHNRYPNVMAIEATRVMVTDKYINANWIDGYHKNSHHAYIATQAPVQEAFDRFWEMVWRSNACVIVMLTNFVEAQKRKADQYWPKNVNDVERYGDFELEFLEESLVTKTPEVVEAPVSSLTGRPMSPSPIPKHGKSTAPYTAYIIRKFKLRDLSDSVERKKSSRGKQNTEAGPRKKREVDETKKARTKPSMSETDATTTEIPQIRKSRSKKGEKETEIDNDKGKSKEKAKNSDKSSKERIIYHYHYCSWPDMEVPSNGNDLLEMMCAAEKTQLDLSKTYFKQEDGVDEESSSLPTVVHCSAGIGINRNLGRAGTYILIHTALTYARENGAYDFNTVPVKDMVTKLRQQRCGMIQTKEQYIFSTSVIRDYLLQLQQNNQQLKAATATV